MRKYLIPSGVLIVLALFVLKIVLKKDIYDIRIVTPPSIIASLPHWVAEEKKIYERLGLKVHTVDLTNSNLMVTALQGGDADVLPAVSLVDVINQSSKGNSVPIIYSHSRMTDNPPFEALSVMRGSPISNLQDLKNKRIAVYPGITSEAAVKAFLAKHDVDISGIEFLPLPPPEHIKMLQAGEVDCSHIYEPDKTANLENGKTRLISNSIYASFNTPSAIGVSVISQSFIKSNIDASEKFFEAWDKAVDFINNNEEEARRLLVKKLNITESVAQKATWVNVTKVDEFDPSLVKATVESYRFIGVIDSSFTITNEYFVNAVSK